MIGIVARYFKFSGFLLVALALSTVLGLVVGSSFVWAAPSRAWEYLIAGFLWVLIVSVVTGLGRLLRERIRRGEWRRCLALGCEMTFPTTTMYLLAVALGSSSAAQVVTLPGGEQVVGRPDIISIAPIFYGGALVLALLLGPGYMLTSPFPRQPKAETE
jgi:hypothetical protein